MDHASFTITNYTLGRGSLEKISELTDGRIALIVDRNILNALDLEKTLIENYLKGCEVKIICDIRTEPTIALLNDAIKEMQEYAPKHIIAVGGGSVMDTAKALWLFYELPHYTWEQALTPYAVESFPGKADLTVVPTTSGTGSETTGCSVIKDEDLKKRMILSNEIIPQKAILDFDLLKSLPKKNIAYSGTDALAHALESAVSKLSNQMVREIACQAAVTLIKELPHSINGDQDAREKVHVAATMAGGAIGNSITGMAHGMDFAGGDFHLPHGLMTGMLLPYTMNFLMPQPVYQQVADQLGIQGSGIEKQNELISMIKDLYKKIGMPQTLKEAGVPESEYLDKIPSYIELAENDANIMFCPQKPSKEEFETLFKQFYYGY